MSSLMSTVNQKSLFVISDALRYECASELKEMIERQDRYQAKIEPMLGCLPSYTQLVWLHSYQMRN